MAKNSKKKNHRTSRKKRVKSSIISRKSLAVVLLCSFIAFSIVYGINYFHIFNTQNKVVYKSLEKKSTQDLMDKMKLMLDKEKERLKNLPKIVIEKKVIKLPPVIKEKENKIEKETQSSEIIDYKKSLEKKSIKHKVILHVKKKKYVLRGKPKLAIIIDDVAFAKQIRQIHKIPFKVTPSFFPPTQRHPDTIKYEKEFKFTMVHLPLEAIGYLHPEPETLNVKDSFQIVKNRILTIKKEFPRVLYYNNHTGSKFTSNLKAMDRLIRVMKDAHLYFVDSRTTADTKAPYIAQKYNLSLYSRDVFLDNSDKKEDIIKQLKKAVKIAKKNGFAIAIGHPHKNTLKVLINAKYLLKDVDLVYLNEI